MYTVTSLPFESRTRVIFRRAEFGFLGVIVRTKQAHAALLRALVQARATC